MSVGSDKIFLGFAWHGPTSLRGSSEVRGVDLVFKDQNDKISIHFSEKMRSTAPQEFLFTCRKYLDERGIKLLKEETHLELLHVTIKEIESLILKARFFEKFRAIDSLISDCSTGKVVQKETFKEHDREIDLEIPKEFETDGRYTLVVTSNDLALSAQVIKEEESISITLDELDLLDVDKLKFYYEDACRKDQQLEIDRINASKKGDVEELNEILRQENANSELLMNLTSVLLKKGVNTSVVFQPIS